MSMNIEEEAERRKGKKIIIENLSGCGLEEIEMCMVETAKSVGRMIQNAL